MNKQNLVYSAFLLLTIFVVLFAIKIFDIGYPITVTNINRSSELAVVGEGKVDVIPDVAYVDVGITVNNVDTVESAQAEINKTNNAIINAMKELKIDKKDIKTSNYSIYPNYNYENNSNQITGYSGNVTITIKTKDPNVAGKVIEMATKAGANQIQGTRFVVDAPEKYREQARGKAIDNAKAQATSLAKSLGIRLGRVVNIIESTPNVDGSPVYLKSAAQGMGGGGGTPAIEAGSEIITSVVTLYFEKK